MKNSTQFTQTAVILHWAIAILLMGNCALGLVAETFPDEHIRLAIDTHKSVGITVLGLVLLRILWRVGHPPPPLPTGHPHWQLRAASAGHAGLYVLMLALPLSGWMHDSAWKDAATHPMSLFGTIPWPRIALIADIESVRKEHFHTLFGNVHTLSSYVLYGLLAVHIAAALKHQYVDKQSDKARGMLPSRSAAKT